MARSQISRITKPATAATAWGARGGDGQSPATSAACARMDELLQAIKALIEFEAAARRP